MGKSFTSAIFFDMENLLKGYGLDAQALGRLSLKEIVQAIRVSSDTILYDVR
jgi:hypothetical protein